MLGKMGKAVLVALDIVWINLAVLFALGLRFEGSVDAQYKSVFEKNIVWSTLLFLSIFMIFGLYKSLWRYASVREMLQVIGACLVGVVVFRGIDALDGMRYPRSVYIIYPLLLITLLLCTRFSYRFVRKMGKTSIAWVPGGEKWLQLSPKKRVMLIGAGEAGSIIIKDMKTNWRATKEIVVVVDDNRNKHQARLHGIRVAGDTSQIVTLAKQYEVDEIIIALPSATKKRIAEIIKICNETRCKLRIFPGIDHAFDKAHGKERGQVSGEERGQVREKMQYIRDVRVEDLLGREEIVLDNSKLEKVIGGQTVLVTGGGGSIGSELCRQVVGLGPKEVLIFDIYENNAYDLQMELIQNGVPREKLRMLIGSVRDLGKVEEVFSTYKPNLVFHAAAHKHVPLMEANPAEAIKNNVFGTLNVAQCAVKYQTSKFILVSTDKAVNPTNVMGATKRICEMIVQAINSTTAHTDFVAVRFGNVLGSNGSVIPLFKRQLEAGGPLTVTHPEIIRYFMTIPEAVRLILEATTFATGGEIFVLDMGEPVKIHDLAKNFIKLSGMEEGKDIEICFTGLRPGEKLFEELLMDEEGLGQTASNKIFVGKPGEIAFDVLLEALEDLRDVLEEGKDIREALKKLVPTYTMVEERKLG